MGEMRNVYGVILVEDLKGRDFSEDPDVDGMITLEWILIGWEGVSFLFIL
jgi:hypothetical protein